MQKNDHFMLKSISLAVLFLLLTLGLFNWQCRDNGEDFYVPLDDDGRDNTANGDNSDGDNSNGDNSDGGNSNGGNSDGGSSDMDNDSIVDSIDVDDDNDGLIEIASRTGLSNIRYNLIGSSYKDGLEAVGDVRGAPTQATALCTTEADGKYLCGYELVGNIDLGGEANPWLPIGNSGSNSEGFQGFFEGNGHTISNVYIRGDTVDRDLLGLFARLDGATVRNLRIETVDIRALFPAGSNFGEENCLGALAALALGSTSIHNVVVYDTDNAIDVQGANTDNDQYIGGLIGYQSGGTILGSYATGSISGDDGYNDSIGGLVGYHINNSSILSSWATGDVDGGDGSDYVGGLIGLSIGSKIAASYATGNVNGGPGDEDAVGGLVGWKVGGSIAASYATGAINGGEGEYDSAGGLVSQNDSNSSIIASYATGNINGGSGSNTSVGALVSFQSSNSSITVSYGFGSVVGNTINTTGGNGATDSPWPTGVTAAANLTSSNSGSSWSAQVWDFGANGQRPAIKYISGYDSTTGAYSCDAALFLPLVVTCGETLLPGQR